MKLVSPSAVYKEQYITALAEATAHQTLTTLEKLWENETFDQFIQRLAAQERGINLPTDWVPATTLWLIDQGEFIGRVSIRHRLNEELGKINGHIGYFIRPSKRQMGYGKKILALALPEAERLGLAKVLVTCDEDNIGSRKIIEANGGVLENIVDQGHNLPPKRHYWITL
ncbi:MAG: GNAT family N-acetyltransferase [Patescibacteria group bacterium]